MDQKDIYKEMMRYMKYMYDLSMMSMQMMFDHADKVQEFLVAQGGTHHEESRKYLADWIGASKKTRDEYIRMMNENFQKMEDYLKIE
jgi:polyhydroxyalkanoate synthesis regulator phasin